MGGTSAHALLQNVVVESLDQSGLVLRSLTGFGIDKEVTGVLKVDRQVLLSSGL